MASDKYLNLLFLVGLLCTTVFLGCEDPLCQDETNPACENYDPCWDRRTPVSADFTIAHPIRRGAIWGQGDSSLYAPILTEAVPCKFITFTATDETADSYQWQVDENPDNARTGRSFSMSFPEWTLGQTIEVTLITERLSDSSCLNPVLLKDTVVKSFDMVNPNRTKIAGLYRGSWSDNPEHVFDMDIAVDLSCLVDPCPSYGTCDTLIYLDNFFGLNCQPFTQDNVNFYINGAVFDYVAMRKEEECAAIPEPFYAISAQNTVLRLLNGDSLRIDCRMVKSSYTPGQTEAGPTVFIGKKM